MIEGKTIPLTTVASPPLTQKLDIASVGIISRFMASAQATNNLCVQFLPIFNQAEVKNPADSRCQSGYISGHD